MKNIAIDAKRQLKSIAYANLYKNVETFSILPWISVVFPWNWLVRRPLMNSLTLVAGLYVMLLITNYQQMSLLFALKFFFVAVSIFMGFFFVFFYARTYEKLFYDIEPICELPSDTFRRWYVNSLCPLWGSVNIKKAEARGNYKFKDTIKNDGWILAQFFLWSIINSIGAIFVTRMYHYQYSLGWFFQIIFVFLWAYSFMWASHYCYASLSFLFKLGKLPMRSGFYMPDSLTLKKAGARFINIGWINLMHFGLLIAIMASFQILEAHPNEPPVVTIILTLIALFLVGLYFIWSFMSIIITHVVLSRNMARYKVKRVEEYFNQIEKTSDIFLNNPNKSTYENLKEKIEYRNIFSKIPSISFSAETFLSFTLQVIVSSTMIFLYFKYSVGGVGEISRLLGLSP